MSATMRADLPRTRAPAAPRSRAGAVIASVGVSLPAAVVTNEAIAARLGVADGWIERRTGIRTRRIAEPAERLATHATAAAARALEGARLDAADVDLVIVATLSQDELTPTTAPLVAHALGAHQAGAFDVGAACSAFLYGLAMGTAQIESGRASHVLLIGADFITRIVDYEGQEQFCEASGACRTRDVATQAAKGYDNLTGLGSVGEAFVHLLAGK